MPRALFTSATRSELIGADVFASARRIKNTKAEDQFESGACVVTCRYWIKGGDFVSHQILGCHNAIRVGRLRCKQKKIALDRVGDTKSVVGLAGPDDEVEELARVLSSRFPGVIVTEDAAVVAG